MSESLLCPVCNGNGQVSQGFYSHPGDYPYWASSGTNLEECRSCKGKGWVEVTKSGDPKNQMKRLEAAQPPLEGLSTNLVNNANKREPPL